MESTEQFILSGNLSKSSKNEKMALNTVISGNKKLLPEDGITSTIDLYEKYLEERRNSNKFRLSININPFFLTILLNSCIALSGFAICSRLFDEIQKSYCSPFIDDIFTASSIITFPKYLSLYL